MAILTHKLPSVHPRGRGEHAILFVYINRHCGSSPRARGTRLGKARRRHCERFIPAGAGNTIEQLIADLKAAVHPRGRGEHSRDQVSGEQAAGSSPRARGTRRPLRGQTTQERFIPAGAGNTLVQRLVQLIKPVHPRGRGEHTWRHYRAFWSSGSSPRARGTLYQQDQF